MGNVVLFIGVLHGIPGLLCGLVPNDQSADDGKSTALTVSERIKKAVAGFIIGFLAGGAAGFLLHKVFLSHLLQNAVLNSN